MKARSGLVRTERIRCVRSTIRLRQVFFVVALLAAGPVYPQAASPVTPVALPGGDLMVTPPPVRILAYPTETSSEMRSNYLSAGAIFNAAYIDNLYAGSGGTAIKETTYSLVPTLALDQRTPRRHTTLSFSPGFTFYQPTDTLNEIDEGATVIYQYRLTPHSELSLNDRFSNSSTSFNPAMLGVGGTVRGTTETVTPGIIAPFTQRLTNAANGEFTLQMSRSSMIGASGTATTLHYGKTPEMGGLYDSSSRGGLAFYSKRFLGMQYLGASYEFAQILAYPVDGDSTTGIETTALFYTVYPKPTLSLSIAGGPQRYRLTQTSSPRSSEWQPAASASIGWQGHRTSFAASYSHGVTAGGGLLGAFNSDSGAATTRWQITRTWTTGAGASYAISRPVTLRMLGAESGGHSISGNVTVEHSIGRDLSVGFAYNRLHQSYRGIPAVSSNPDSNRGSAYISWHFMRPWGR